MSVDEEEKEEECRSQGWGRRTYHIPLGVDREKIGTRGGLVVAQVDLLRLNGDAGDVGRHERGSAARRGSVVKLEKKGRRRG